MRGSLEERKREDGEGAGEGVWRERESCGGKGGGLRKGVLRRGRGEGAWKVEAEVREWKGMEGTSKRRGQRREERKEKIGEGCTG